jgi:hypothetical protein
MSGGVDTAQCSDPFLSVFDRQWNVCIIMELYLCSFYVDYCRVYDFLLSRCLIAICFMSFALCYVLINCFIFFMIHFMFVFLFCVLCFLFCVFCVFVLFCVFLPMYIVVYFLLVYNFTDHCHRVETQLPLINIISYILLHVLRFPTIDLSHITSNCPTFAIFVTRTKKVSCRIPYYVYGHWSFAISFLIPVVL